MKKLFILPIKFIMILLLVRAIITGIPATRRMER
jgi:hypothetical protein